MNGIGCCKTIDRGRIDRQPSQVATIIPRYILLLLWLFVGGTLEICLATTTSSKPFLPNSYCSVRVKQRNSDHAALVVQGRRAYVRSQVVSSLFLLEFASDSSIVSFIFLGILVYWLWKKPEHPRLLVFKNPNRTCRITPKLSSPTTHRFVLSCLIEQLFAVRGDVLAFFRKVVDRHELRRLINARQLI